MIILTILALAALANGYRLENPPPSAMGVHIIRSMCEKNGVNYTTVEIASLNFVKCMENDFGVKELEGEIKEAYMYKSYDAFKTVFKKYCRKTPELKACYHTMIDAVAPCLVNEKQELITVSNKINDRILAYLCENDGSIITEFVTGGGPQCFQEKTYEIMMCTENSKKSIQYMEQNITVSTSDIRRVYDELLKCVLRSVKTCHSSVPSKMLKTVVEIISLSTHEATDPTAAQSNETKTNTTNRAPGVSTDGCQNNIQMLFGQNGVHYNTEGSKTNASKPLRKLFRASGNVAVALNAEIYI